MMRYDANKKSAVVAYVLWFLFGSVGGHRFYLKRIGTAVTMLLIFVVSIPLAFVGIGFVGLGVVWVLGHPGRISDSGHRSRLQQQADI
jgi:TM2 domain-containing membrane protein YozV